MKPGKPRIRATLLVLLWVWAACVFLVLDLFKTIPEFDRLRPESKLYQGMRAAAHAMIGEPIARQDGSAPRPRATQPRTTPERPLATLEARGDRDQLWRVVNDAARTARVRRGAARLLGRFGTEDDLARLLEADLPAAVRNGAVLGLGELGSTWAADQLLALARTGSRAARTAVARLATPAAGAVLRAALLDENLAPELVAAMCKALGRIKQPASARALADVVADTTHPSAVRAAAANSLGRLGDRGALLVVANARDDTDPEVARQARLAHSRLTHVH